MSMLRGYMRIRQASQPNLASRWKLQPPQEVERTWRVAPTGSLSTSDDFKDRVIPVKAREPIHRQVVGIAKRTFFPKGYPQSVSREYTEFSWWQAASSVSGSLTSVLSTQSLLYAIGLGAGALPVAAAVSWVLKDGMGHLGGVMYAAIVGERFDKRPKQVKFHATILLQACCALEVLAPLWPGGFLLLASVSNVGKNIAWIATSATKAQMHQTLALRDNLGDITGKAGSQTTAAALIGTTLGISISAGWTGQDILSIAAVFLPFSALSIYANYRSACVIPTHTVDRVRGDILMHGLLKKNIVMNPHDVAEIEAFVRSAISPFRTSLRTNPPISSIPPVELSKIFPTRASHYIWGGKEGEEISLWWREGCEPREVIVGYADACIHRWVREGGERPGWKAEEIPTMLKEKGWDMRNLYLGHETNPLCVDPGSISSHT